MGGGVGRGGRGREVPAWGISRHLAAHPEAEHDDTLHAGPEPATPPAERLLPWVAGPRPAPAPEHDRGAQYGQYLTEAAELIGARVTALADTAIRHRSRSEEHTSELQSHLNL